MPEIKKRERFQKVGSTNYEDDKRKLMSRSQRGLFLTMEALTTQLEAGKPLRDEQIRFMKNFPSTLAALEMREAALEPDETEGLPEGKLRKFVEDTFRFLEATGFTDPRRDGLLVMKEANYFLCDFCNEFHRVLDPCPFKTIAEKRKVRLVAEKEKEIKDPNRPIDLTESN